MIVVVAVVAVAVAVAASYTTNDANEKTKTVISNFVYN